MTRTPPTAAGRAPWMLLWLCCWGLISAVNPAAAQTNAVAAAANAEQRFDIQSYMVEGKSSLPEASLTALFSRHTGTNIELGEIVRAAADLQAEYRRQGFPDVSVAIAPAGITNGVARLLVFEAAQPQIVVAGKRYEPTGLAVGAVAATNAPSKTATTNIVPGLNIQAYEVVGNDLLPDEVLQALFSKYTGTNVVFDDLVKMMKELTLEYRDRGYATVSPSISTNQPGLTNAVLTIHVFEGSLSSIIVSGNRYFSSNNVMRALPSLQTNMILNSRLMQPEFDRANASQDRQISPQIEPGPDVNTSLLRLQVKDRLPLHVKMEFNNQSSPGTPDLRLNGSAVYNNLWQLEHSLGVQYGFSPEAFKADDKWNFYDRPLVVNYSGFYRLPLGNPDSMMDVAAGSPNKFGYDEATRQFRLPPPAGAPELNLYASRSVIDTGIQNTGTRIIFSVPGVREVSERDDQQDITINETVGFRLSGPLPEWGGWRSVWSSGLDLKTYELVSQKTNSFKFTEAHVLENGDITNVVSEVHSAVPTTRSGLQYVPFAFRYDGSRRDSLGSTAFGMGLSANPWYSGTRANFQGIAGSAQSRGHWVTLTPSLTREFTIHTNWVLSLRADGQWATEPLISNEQFGAGGVGSVRGYHEGAVFGDTGWHVSAEQKTPPHVVGLVSGGLPLTIRGSIYMDYAETFLLDPQGRRARTPLWGAGFGGVASIGSRWDARFWFSMPLLDISSTERYQPFFNFSLTGQF